MGLFSRIRNFLSSGGVAVPTEAGSTCDVPKAEPAHELDGVRLVISYTDADRITTERLVTCKRLTKADDGERLLAFCHLSKVDHAFLLSRILDVSVPGNDERFDSIHAFLLRYPEGNKHVQKDENSATGALLDEISDELRVLAYIAYADTKLHKEEDGLVSLFVRGRAEELGHEVSAHYNHAKIMEWFHKENPDFGRVERAVYDLASRSTENLKRIWEISARVMEADGEITVDELDRFHELANLIESVLKRDKES